MKLVLRQHRVMGAAGFGGAFAPLCGTALLLLCAFALTGCGKTGTPETTGNFALLRDGAEITLDAPAAEVLSGLGAPFVYAEAALSDFPGVERTYCFSGMELRTHPCRDGERISSVRITGSGTKTAEGLCVGSTAEQVQSCFGLASPPGESCTVIRAPEAMTLTIRNNVVTQIYCFRCS